MNTRRDGVQIDASQLLGSLHEHQVKIQAGIHQHLHDQGCEQEPCDKGLRSQVVRSSSFSLARGAKGGVQNGLAQGEQCKMNAHGQDHTYNDIYSKLVEDPHDIMGIIAYSFYKQKKLEFVREFRREESRLPTDAELKVFYVTSNGEASLSSYRAKADALSREFFNAVLAEQLRTVNEESDLELLRRLETFKPNFWTGVLQNIIASGSFVLVIGAILFIAWSVKFGPTEVLKQITGYQIQAEPLKTPD